MDRRMRMLSLSLMKFRSGISTSHNSNGWVKNKRLSNLPLREGGMYEHLHGMEKRQLSWPILWLLFVFFYGWLLFWTNDILSWLCFWDISHFFPCWHFTYILNRRCWVWTMRMKENLPSLRILTNLWWIYLFLCSILDSGKCIRHGELLLLPANNYRN